MSFREWLQLNEGGHIFFRKSGPVMADLGRGEQAIDGIDLNVELWINDGFRPPDREGVSLAVKNGWINAKGDRNIGMLAYYAEPGVTREPKYKPFRPDWLDHATVSVDNEFYGDTEKSFGPPAQDRAIALKRKQVG